MGVGARQHSTQNKYQLVLPGVDVISIPRLSRWTTASVIHSSIHFFASESVPSAGATENQEASSQTSGLCVLCSFLCDLLA